MSRIGISSKNLGSNKISVENLTNSDSEILVFSNFWKLNQTCHSGKKIEFDIFWGSTPVFIQIKDEIHSEQVEYENEINYLIVKGKDKNVIVRYDK